MKTRRLPLGTKSIPEIRLMKDPVDRMTAAGFLLEYLMKVLNPAQADKRWGDPNKKKPMRLLSENRAYFRRPGRLMDAVGYFNERKHLGESSSLTAQNCDRAMFEILDGIEDLKKRLPKSMVEAIEYRPPSNATAQNTSKTKKSKSRKNRTSSNTNRSRPKDTASRPKPMRASNSSRYKRIVIQLGAKITARIPWRRVRIPALVIVVVGSIWMWQKHQSYQKIQDDATASITHLTGLVASLPQTYEFRGVTSIRNSLEASVGSLTEMNQSGNAPGALMRSESLIRFVNARLERMDRTLEIRSVLGEGSLQDWQSVPLRSMLESGSVNVGWEWAQEFDVSIGNSLENRSKGH